MPPADMLAAGGLKLPTTWDYVRGFAQGGADGLRVLRELRGDRTWSPGRSRRGRWSPEPNFPDFHDPHHFPPPHDPDFPYYPHFDPEPPPHHLPPGNPMPFNPNPGFAPRVGEIRPIDRHFDPARASAILNPVSSDRTLRYLLDGEPMELPPGHYQELGIGRSWRIEFDRGGSFGQKRYSIGNGLFTFMPTPHGWNLFRRPE